MNIEKLICTEIEFDNKKYQIIFTQVKDKSPAKYMIRQITEK
mgnify:CR=1 FL=1